MANNNLETTEKESKQYIVVMVGSEQYGIDISYINILIESYEASECNLSDQGEVSPIKE